MANGELGHQDLLIQLEQALVELRGHRRVFGRLQKGHDRERDEPRAFARPVALAHLDEKGETRSFSAKMTPPGVRPDAVTGPASRLEQTAYGLRVELQVRSNGVPHWRV